MSPVIIYILKVIICSAVLFFYYRLALYNKLFHQWNRVYLLSAVLISLFLPLARIEVSVPGAETSSQVFQLLEVVSSGDANGHEEVGYSTTGITVTQIGSVIYLLVAVTLLIVLLRGLFRLWKLYRNHIRQRLNGINLIHTREKDAPFSFFRNIFWNTRIDLSSPAGIRILNHEIIHVREMHSADQLLMNIVLVLCWLNPFFWLIRKEMRMVHEFIADRKTVEDQDLAIFSQMILTARFPGHEFGLTSNFSSSSIKRRLLMLTKIKHSTVNYYGRLLLLPLLVLVFAAFSLRMERLPGVHDTLTVTALDQPVTIVIDAGHGGKATGGIAQDGTLEKDLTLSIARRIRELNKDGNVNIVLTREQDVYIPVNERVDRALKVKPDAFISIHVQAAVPRLSDFEIFIMDSSSGFAKRSQLLGSLVAREIQDIYSTSPYLKAGRKNIHLLNAPAVQYPALLIECGNLSNPRSLAFLKDPVNQEKIALRILRAITLFVDSRKDQSFAAVPMDPKETVAFIAKQAVENKEEIGRTAGESTRQPAIRDTAAVKFMPVVFTRKDTVFRPVDDKVPVQITSVVFTRKDTVFLALDKFKAMNLKPDEITR